MKTLSLALALLLNVAFQTTTLARSEYTITKRGRVTEYFIKGKDLNTNYKKTKISGWSKYYEGHSQPGCFTFGPYLNILGKNVKLTAKVVIRAQIKPNTYNSCNERSWGKCVRWNQDSDMGFKVDLVARDRKYKPISKKVAIRFRSHKWRSTKIRTDWSWNNISYGNEYISSNHMGRFVVKLDGLNSKTGFRDIEVRVCGLIGEYFKVYVDSVTLLGIKN